MGAQDQSKLMLLNLIKHQRPDIVTSLLCQRSICMKVSISIHGRGKIEIKNEKNLKVFIDYSETIDDVYENLEDYKPTKNRKGFIVFDYMIVVMEAD